MAKSDFENLKVYQLSEVLADEIWNVVMGWDRFARDTVGGQIVRAADSVGANIGGRLRTRQLSRQPPIHTNGERIAERDSTFPTEGLQAKAPKRIASQQDQAAH